MFISLRLVSLIHQLNKKRKVMKTTKKIYETVEEMTNSKTWNNVRSSNAKDLSFDDLYDVLEYINNSITREEAEKMYEAIDSAIDAVKTQWD